MSILERERILAKLIQQDKGTRAAAEKLREWGWTVEAAIAALQ